ncbi:helix-turn-helix domain-containing protein [Streptomyces sp. BBFR51]|uniref:helix-turn-helix domain-containing protein n=1 Tax=Streptomyces sp. BBFR51 TaxID=3372856 RepID=UPI0037DDD2BD
MPRRATPLNPNDGPKARFALALRALRDQAGFNAKSVEAIAAENHMPKSTLYAAMRGERIPTLPVLEALVRAWNGNEAEWTKRRTETEDEVERLRLAKLKAPTVGLPPTRLDRHADTAMLMFTGQQWLQAEERAPAMAAPSKSLQAAAGRRLVRLRAEETVDTSPRGVLLQQLQEQEGMAAVWDVLRERAGAPTIRQIAEAAGTAQRTVASVLNGELPSRRSVDSVYRELVGRREDLVHRPVRPRPADG